MRSINESEIKDILRNREEKTSNIRIKILNMYQELENTEGLLLSTALPSTELRGMPGGKGGHKDLGDVLQQYYQRLYNRNEEIRSIMWALAEEEESISRVWVCFQALPDPYYSILRELYVENQLYQAVEDRFKGSHKTFERYRQKGIEQLLCFYYSGNSIAELMRRQNTGTVIKRKKKGKQNTSQEKQEYEQMSFLPGIEKGVTGS